DEDGHRRKGKAAMVEAMEADEAVMEEAGMCSEARPGESAAEPAVESCTAETAAVETAAVEAAAMKAAAVEAATEAAHARLRAARCDRCSEEDDAPQREHCFA